jgi:hypothetical protein
MKRARRLIGSPQGAQRKQPGRLQMEGQHEQVPAYTMCIRTTFHHAGTSSTVWKLW